MMMRINEFTNDGIHNVAYSISRKTVELEITFHICLCYMNLSNTKSRHHPLMKAGGIPVGINDDARAFLCQINFSWNAFSKTGAAVT